MANIGDVWLYEICHTDGSGGYRDWAVSYRQARGLIKHKLSGKIRLRRLENASK